MVQNFRLNCKAFQSDLYKSAMNRNQFPLIVSQHQSLLLVLTLMIFSCSDKVAAQLPKKTYKWEEFVMGADLSYVNQVED